MKSDLTIPSSFGGDLDLNERVRVTYREDDQETTFTGRIHSIARRPERDSTDLEYSVMPDGAHYPGVDQLSFDRDQLEAIDD